MTTKLYHEICEWLRDLIAGTHWEGHVYAVGGCCRDEFLGREIQDLDLAVDTPMGGVKFARWLHKRHLTVGHPTYFLKYGTAKLRLRRYPDDEIELVQTRREQYTKETSRCPEVTFGTIEEDCFRRDFTVNSLYYDITRRRTVDITGLGIPDMEAGLLRTPLDPDETFNDDPVRILRCLRFANRFGWTIYPPVYAALLRQIHRIEIVSRERVHSELCKMLNGLDPIKMMNTLRETGALQIMIPQWAELCASRTLWDAAMERLALVIGHDPEAPTRMRLAAIMVGIKPQPQAAAKLAREVMVSLRFDRPVVADVAFMVSFANVDPATLDNPRRMRAMQNLAAVPARMDVLCAFLTLLGRGEAAAAIRKRSQELTDQHCDGFNRPRVPADPPADPAPTPRRRRRRGGRRHRRRSPRK